MRTSSRHRGTGRSTWSGVSTSGERSGRFRSIAEDAAQEAFAPALVRWGRLRQRPWAAGWVTTTALNVARRQLRGRRNADELTSPRDRAVDVERSLDVRRAIGALPRRQQEAVVLHYLSDLPVAVVAHVMGCEEGTVKAHLSKARAALSVVLARTGASELNETSGRKHE